MNLKEWGDYPATRIIKWDLRLYKEAFDLICDKLAKEAGTDRDSVARAWLTRARLKIREPIVP